MNRSFLTFLLVVLLTGVYANQGYLGVSVRSDAVEQYKGLRIVNVFDDGAAWVAGLHENDLITHFNGKPITSSGEFNRLLSAYEWGDLVHIGYVRDGAAQHADIVLGYRVRTKTYEILKSEQILGEVIWYFDDNTTIVMKDGRALSITKKFEDGQKETFDLTEMEDYNSVPQRFRDLQDKLDVIKRTVEEQADQGSHADQITFVKENKGEAVQTEPAIRKFEVSEFNVFPNPSNGQFEVKLITTESGPLQWDIFDVRGSSIQSGNVNDFNGTFSRSFNLSSKFTGTYLLYIQVGDTRVSKQLILN